MKKIKKAVNEDLEVQVLTKTPEELRYKVINDGRFHLITRNWEGIWNCDCEDFYYRGNKDTGSYLCKHILAVLFYENNRLKR